MFFGLMTVGAATLFFIILLIRVASTVYIRDIDPYIRNSERPPLFDFLNSEEEKIEKQEPKPFTQFVSEYNDRRRNNIQEKHEQFLRTKLGQSYLRILNGNNK